MMHAFNRHRRFHALVIIALVVCAFIAVAMPLSAHAQTTPTPVATCNLKDGFTFNGCIWYPLVAAVSSAFISFAAWLLSIAGTLFNWLVDNTIVSFKIAIFDKVSPGVDAGWTAFRDLANIVIIAMFTFIAISIILDNKEYGQMRLVAKVLIIAILINFSLLFTKMIIDASNFTAAQFYTAMNYPSAAQGATLGATTGFTKVGIAGAFVSFLGVTSVGDTFNAVQKFAETGGGGWIALVHGFFATVLLGGAAFVFLYGSYLLVSRAVLLIFLMITSAIAFATYLIPKVSDSEYGWSTWWRSLLGSAALAPLLMIFLSITMDVAAKLKAPPGGTLGRLVSGDGGGPDVGALFAYLIILGLLWGSFYLAGVFAKTISGINMGALLTAAPLALASRFLVAPPLRQLAGRGFAKRSLELGGEIDEKKLALKDLTKGTPEYKKALDEISAKMKARERADTLAKSSFNAANLGPVKAATAAIGLPSYLTGAQAKPKGFADVAKERAKAATERAEGLVVSRADAEEKLMNKRKESFRIEKDILRQQRDAAATLLEAAKKTAEAKKPEVDAIETERRAAEGELKNHIDVRAQIETDSSAQIKQLGEKLAQAKTPAEREEARGQLEGVRAQREGAIQEQDNKIKVAQTNVGAIRGRMRDLEESIQKPISDAQTEVNTLQKKLDEFDATMVRKVQEEAKDVTKATSEAVPEMAERIVHRRLTNFLPRIFGEDPKNDTMSRYARSAAKKHVKKMPLREQLTILKDIQKEEGGEAKSESGEAGAAGLPPATGH